MNPKIRHIIPKKGDTYLHPIVQKYLAQFYIHAQSAHNARSNRYFQIKTEHLVTWAVFKFSPNKSPPSDLTSKAPVHLRFLPEETESYKWLIYIHKFAFALPAKILFVNRAEGLCFCDQKRAIEERERERESKALLCQYWSRVCWFFGKIA